MRELVIRMGTPKNETVQDPTAGTVSIAFVREVIAAAARRGQPAAPLLSAAQIPARSLENDAARVSPGQFGALWLAVGRALDDEFFGLDSRRVKVGSFALIARAGLQARNLREVLVGISRFFRILLDDIRVDFEASAERAELRLVDLLPRGPAGEIDRVLAHETLLTLIHGLACWLIARRIPVRQALFAYPRPPWGEEYKAVYSSDSQFDAPVTRMIFDSLLLETPVAQTERTLGDFLRGAPGNFILKYKNENSLSSRVRRHLRSLPPSDWPSFEVLADEFHIGATTLRRRLEREGTSFSTIRDAVRRDLAISHLQRSDASIADIALTLGFAEPSAFHRAFKQWTGVRPSVYRGDAKPPRTREPL